MIIAIITALTIINAIILGLIFLVIHKLKKRFETALGPVDDTESLSSTISSYFKKLNVTDKKLNHIRKSYSHLADMAGDSFQKIGVVRFNPFRRTGGDQSFVLAMLDSHDSGFLLTSIHSREGTRVYIKPITYGSSKHNLSTEEEAALQKAKKTAKKDAD